MLSPKFGILSIVVKNVLEGKIPDAQILPVTINYEKVLEGTSFTYEMMGESKVKESLSRLIKAADVLKENFGRIYIEMGEPISVKKYFEKSNKKYEETLNELG
jgi:glycerol-3-phosphate O-acyltransferase